MLVACRLFLLMDPAHGEISRAMRNRGIEICILPEVSIHIYWHLQCLCEIVTINIRLCGLCIAFMCLGNTWISEPNQGWLDVSSVFNWYRCNRCFGLLCWLDEFVLLSQHWFLLCAEHLMNPVRLFQGVHCSRMDYHIASSHNTWKYLVGLWFWTLLCVGLCVYVTVLRMCWCTA